MRSFCLMALAAILLISPSFANGDDFESVAAQFVGHGHHGHHHHWHGHYHHRYYRYPSPVRFSFNIGSVWGGYRSYLPYRSYYVAPYCYSTRVYRYGYSVPSPVIYYGASLPAAQPAELAFGPQAVKQFMGVDRDFALGDLKRDDPPLVLGAPVANRIEPKVRETNWDAHRRALTFMNRGDDAFAQGQYAAAIADYDKAIQNAPDVAEAYLRRAFGLIAAGEFDSAFEAIERAVTVDPDVVTNGRLELADLYQGNDQVKQQHLEAVAEVALADRTNGKALVLLGTMLHLDRQVLRAERFFQQAILVSRDASETARAFLPKPNDPI